MSPRTLHQYEAALESSDPVEALRTKVADRLRVTDAASVYQELREFLYELRDAGAEDKQDVVLDVMDSLSGWGNPDFALVPPDQAVSA